MAYTYFCFCRLTACIPFFISKKSTFFRTVFLPKRVRLQKNFSKCVIPRLWLISFIWRKLDVGLEFIPYFIVSWMAKLYFSIWRLFFLNNQHGRMVQRLSRLPPKPKILNPISILFIPLMFLNYYNRFQNTFRSI